jgi:hypothetical protein
MLTAVCVNLVFSNLIPRTQVHAIRPSDKLINLIGGSTIASLQFCRRGHKDKSFMQVQVPRKVLVPLKNQEPYSGTMLGSPLKDPVEKSTEGVSDVL